MKDLYKHLKGTKKKLDKKDFKDSILDLCLQFLKKGKHLTKEQKEKVYQAYSHLKIMLRDF